MKLKITVEEAIDFVKRSLNLPPDVEVVITRPNSSIKRKEIEEFVAEIESLNRSVEGKIRAIKRFRERVPSSLTESKYSVENWSKVKKIMLAKRRWPIFNGIYPDIEVV